MRRFGPAPELWPFAVEPDRVQLTWHMLPPGDLEISVAPTGSERSDTPCSDRPSTDFADGPPSAIVRDGLRGPGALVLTGLRPGRSYVAVVRHPRSDGRSSRAAVATSPVFRTPPHAPGEELCRFATVSDLHLGEYRFGYFGTMADLPGHDEMYPVRAFRHALDALTRWGAEHLAVKGDVTTESRLDQWELFAKLTADLPMPMSVIPGNHDTRRLRTVKKGPVDAALWVLRGGPIARRVGPTRTGEPIDPREGLAHIGHPFPGFVRQDDLPGVRLILADTSLPNQHLGSFQHVAEEVADLAADAQRAGSMAWVGGHHFPMRWPVPHFWPPGVLPNEARPFIDRLAAANPRSFYSAGHTHRNRRYQRGGITCTEVGSPKDFPGTWAGYVVHEGGIRQVTYRVAGSPDGDDIVPWLDHSAKAALGAWGRWSPGTLADRCFSLAW